MKRVINLTSVRAKLGNKATSLNTCLRSVSSTKRATYVVASATAFIIAPVAALTLNAKANSSVNLETGTSAAADSSATTDALLNNAVEASAETSQSTTGDSESSSNVETTLNVNGEEYDVPENGNVNEVITNEDGSTTHVVVNSSSSSSDDDQNTRSKVRVNSSTSVRTYTRSSQ